jgi:hypothetical protein
LGDKCRMMMTMTMEMIDDDTHHGDDDASCRCAMRTHGWGFHPSIHPFHPSIHEKAHACMHEKASRMQNKKHNDPRVAYIVCLHLCDL